MKMSRHCLSVIADLQPASIEPVRQLDVFPCRSGKLGVEAFLQQELPIDGDVRGVEEIEWNGLTVADQLVSELQSIVVDVVHERGNARSVRPSGVTQAGDEPILVALSMRAGMLGQK